VPAQIFDLEFIRERFEHWVRARVGPRATVGEISAPSTGASNGTFLCVVDVDDATPLDVVVRVQPHENQFLDPDVIFQAGVMEALASASPLPVAPVLWKEPDPTVMGAPFFVMGRVHGRVLPDSHHASGWALELTAGERSRMYDATVQVLAALHDTPLVATFEFVRRSGSGTALARHMQWLQRWHEWAARGRALPVIDEGLAWVLEHCPDDADESVIWGDARPGNMIFADDMSVAAVLDWELAATGPGEIDLGWWLMFEESQTAARGVAPLTGVPDGPAIVARYEALRGREARNLDFYRTMAALQFAIIVQRYVDVQAGAGLMAFDATIGGRSGPGVMLAEAIGLPAPTDPLIL
jgi:aminoglycoside phosphotransferase (APT) family kinase protein